MSDESIGGLERTLLALALTRGPEVVDKATSVLQPEDFYQPAHESIWRAIVHAADDGLAIDAAVIASTLAKIAPDVPQRGIPHLLVELVSDGAFAAGDPAWYAGQIAEAADRRRLISAALQVKQLAENDGLDIGDVRDRATQAIEDVTIARRRSRLARIGDVLDDVIDLADKGTDPALSTPWPDLDRLIGGIAPGRLVVIGARPAVGKSITGTNLALCIADTHKHAVLVASMEMSKEEVTQRMLAADAGVNLTRLIESSLEESDWNAIRARRDQIRALPVSVLDEPSMTVTDIRAAAREMRRERGDLALIVVDYLQLMDAGVKSSNRVEAIGHISRSLKVLARETNSCVVALAQLNRESLRHGDGKPKMSDLRESGSIEADANQVILMHRPDMELPDVEVIVDKNRHGPTGVATLQLQGQYARLVPAVWSPTRGLQ